MANRLQLILAVVVCLLSAGYATLKDPDPSDRSIAFVHVNLIPMDRERVVPDQTVIVRDGRIASIGPADAAEMPDDLSLRIDGRGKYLMPGLADMHVHLARDDEADPEALVVFLAAGVTTVRNMWGEPIHLEWRRRINDGELLGPNIYSTGPITDGDPPFWAGSAVVRTPDEAAKEVATQKRAGYDGIKAFSNLSPEVYNAILEAAKEHDIPVYGHVPTRIRLEKALAGGQKSFEHLTDFMYALLPDDSPVRVQQVDMWGDRSKRNWRGIFLDPYEQADRTRIPALTARAAAAGVWFCPTLAVHRRFAIDAVDVGQFRADPTNKYVPPNKLASWERTAKFLTTDERNDPRTMKRGFDTMLIAVKALRDAGAHLIVGTDTPNPFVVPGFSVHKELKHFVAAGVTPYEAIKAATHDAAEFVDALDEWGTVAEGRRADLLLVEANPLEDVANASKPVGMMVRGRWYPKAELQAKLDLLAEKYAKIKAEGEATVAIENVNVVPMDREAVLPDQTVMVRDGKIVSISPASEADLPVFATRIDGTGKYLMPGLADMHVHPDHPNQLLLFIANGVTTIRNMHGGPKYLEWKQRIANEELLAPFIYTTGPLIDAAPGRVPGSALVDTPEEARLAVIDQKEAGFNYIKVLGGLSQEAYDAVIDESANQGLRVVGHVPPAVGFDYVARAGQLSIEHMDGIAQAAAKDDSPLEDPTDGMTYYEAWKYVDADKVPHVAKVLAAQGTWVSPTLVSWQSDPMPDEIESFLRRPEIRFVWPETIDYWRNTALPSQFVQMLRDGIEGRMLTVRILHEVGVRLVLGTDSPAGFVLHGFGTLRELEILVEAGLTPYEAIEMATRNAAELVGASQEFGTIAIGRRADLLLLEANPLNDVSNVGKRSGVMVRGRWYPQTELEARLETLAAKYAKESEGR